MALFNCPECQKQVSDQAPACPQCGYPIASTTPTPPPAPTSTAQTLGRLISMEPRGFLSTWIMLAILAGVMFGGMMIPVSNVEARMMLGVVFGGLFGLGMAPMTRGVRIAVPFDDKDVFIGKLNIATSELSYQVKHKSDEFLTFQGTSIANFSIGGLSLTPTSFFLISVQIDGHQATIVGPYYVTKKLVERLSDHR